MAGENAEIRRILVADDDSAIRHVLKFNLEAEGFEVHALDNGAGVYPAMRELRPDLLILDIMMPERDGLSVLGEIRDDEAIADTPVVLLTAKATDAEVWAGWQAGADYYITKPFELDEILNFVQYLSVEFQ